MKVSVVFRTKLMAFFENPLRKMGNCHFINPFAQLRAPVFSGGVRPFWAFAGHGPRERGESYRTPSMKFVGTTRSAQSEP